MKSIGGKADFVPIIMLERPKALYFHVIGSGRGLLFGC
jgi:hypothetical protein